jgi:FtsP/CotA-like multicopper oxidase with cupredoxin domain
VAGPIAAAPDDSLDLAGLTEIRSHHGLLETTLIAAPLTVRLGQAQIPGAVFNGLYAGPVLRVHAGDRVIIHLRNNMADPVNLHFHGLQITPAGSGDNMHVLVASGQSYTYDFTIPPDHPAGLFWYHDHIYGAAEAHVMAGLSGAFVIDGFATPPMLAGLRQTLLVLKDWFWPSCDIKSIPASLHCRIVSINGTPQWTHSLPPSGQEIWRIVNQGSNLQLHLIAPGLNFTIIGRDGLPCPPHTIAGPIDILPAGRITILVRADSAGAHILSAQNVPTGSGAGFRSTRPLAIITAQAAFAGMAASAIMPAARLPDDLRNATITARRLVVFDENKDATRYTINGHVYDPSHSEWVIPPDSIEEWTIQNHTSDFHEFHIHQLSFQLTEINHVKQDFTGYIDTVDVPAMGDIKLILPFTSPYIAGHIMFHCHILHHEDRGMMSSIELLAGLHSRICHPPD